MVRASIDVMAFKMRDIVEELTCPVCQGEFDDPRILPCGHCYCLNCIRQLLKKPSVPFLCPECRKETTLLRNDPNLLPKSLLAVRMKEKVKRQSEQRLCSNHDEPMKLFCNNCQVMACINCVLSSHANHDYQLVEVVLLNFAKTVRDKRTALEKQKEALLLAHEANRRTLAEVNEQESNIVGRINTLFDELSVILQRRKEELMIEACACMNTKRGALDSQERALNEMLTQLHGLGKIADAILQSDETLMECHEEVENNIRKKLEECSKLNLHPATEPSNVCVEMTCASELSALTREQWKIISADFTSSTVVHGVQATIDVMCTTPATVSTSKQIQGTHGKSEVNIYFKPVTIHGNCDVYETESGVFEFSYCGTKRGHHRLCVEVNGKYISPVSVFVAVPPNKLGKLVRAIERIHSPNSMAISSNDLLIVNEAGATPRLLVMDRFGENVSYVNCPDVRYPNGLAVDKDGIIYVTDAISNALMKIDQKGILVQKIGSTGNKPGQFDSAGEITIVNDELIYVSDYGNHRIQVFDKNLAFCHHFGSYGSKFGEFNCPGDLAYSKTTKELFIADSKNHRIQAFTLDGKPVREFGGAGLFSGRAKLIAPLNICLDKSEKFLFIADVEEGRILVYTTMGKYVSSFSSKGNGRGQLQRPTRVAMDSDGYVYICDKGNNKIVVF